MSIRGLGLILILPILTIGCVKRETVIPTYVFTAAPTELTVLREDFEKNVGSKVYYAFNSYVLSEEAKSHLKKQAEWLLGHPTVTISIDGYCDKKGNKGYNLMLGFKRAETAKQFLVFQGIDVFRITVNSSGKDLQDEAGYYKEDWESRFVKLTILSI